SAFIFQIEYSLISGNKGIQTFFYPLIFLPFIGQLILLYSIFRKKTNRRVPLIGWILLGLLISVILIVGLLALNVKIIASTLPFIAVSVLFFVLRKKKAMQAGSSQIY